tara:strand:- start:35 stop:1798 length:1764 start_codon:yes stop_codon:yes gene_type:complete
MATELDKLVVKIEADLKGLKRDMAQANKAVGKSSSNMKKSLGGLDGVVNKVKKNFGKLAGVIALGFGGKKVADVSAQFEDLQLTLNTVFKTAESGQAAMDFIIKFAQRTPFDIQTLTKAFIQLGGAGIKPTEKMLTTLGDAASATVNRMQTFEALTRIVTRAVGGGLGLEELEQLVSAGLPVYKILNDELGVTRQEISELGQSAEGAEKIMSALLTGLDKEFGGGMQRASTNLSVAFSNLGIAGTELTKVLGDEFNDSLTDLVNTLSRLFTALQPVTTALGGLFNILIFILDKALLGITIALEKINSLFAFIEKMAIKLLNAFTPLNIEFEESNDSLKEMEEKLGKNIEAMDKSTTANKKAQEQLEKNIEATKEFNDQQLESMRLLEEMSLEPLKQELEKSEEQTQALVDIFDEAGQSISDAFGKAVASGQSFRQSMLDIFQSVVSQVISLIIQLTIIEPMLKRIREAIGGASGQSLGSQILAGAGAIFGSFGGERAMGGNVNPNMPYMVGERGAEMFVPKSAGTIVPNNQMGGGITIEQNLNFATGVSQTVRAEVMNMLPAIRENTLSAVRDARLRGGTFAKDFGA